MATAGYGKPSYFTLNSSNCRGFVAAAAEILRRAAVWIYLLRGRFFKGKLVFLAAKKTI